MEEHSRGAKSLTLHNGSRLLAEPPVRILGGLVLRADTPVGAWTEFGRNIEVQSGEIGRYCEIGPGSIIGATGHPTTWLSVSAFQYKRSTWGWHPTADAVETIDPTAGGRPSFRGDGPAVLGHDVWLGANVVVLKGVTIGTGCIVAANAVVTKDLPPYSVAGGIPARVLKPRLDADLATELLELAWWRFTPNQLSGITFDDPVRAVEQLRERVPGLEPYEPGRESITKPPPPPPSRARRMARRLLR
ncbi:MAG: CatB-related O-acetyltransferase [Aeromicrobium erythreum]